MQIKKMIAVVPLFLALAFWPSHAFSQAKNSGLKSPGFKVARTVQLGGEGGWDYLIVDPATHRLYISRGTHVMVVDEHTGKSIGDILNTAGVHGIALAPALGRGFISDGRAATVTIFNLKDLSVIGTAPTGENPDAIIYDPASSRVFTFNGRGHSATAIDAKQGSVAGAVPLDGKPEFAASDGKGQIFVNIEDKSELTVFDSKALKVLKVIPLAPCESPSGLALDKEHRRVFSVCENKLMAIVDPDQGKVVATVPIGEGPDAAGFDPKLQLAFSSNGRDGNLTVVHEQSPNKFEVAQTVPTAMGARTMTLNPTTHTLYLVTADFNRQAEGARGGRPAQVPGSFKLLVVNP